MRDTEAHEARPWGALLDVDAAASYLSIGRTSLYALIRAGKLRPVRLGGRRRTLIARADLDRLVEEERARSGEVAP